MKKRILQIMSWLLLFTTLVVKPVMAQKPSVCSKEEWEVLKLTNQKRLNLGLEPLSTTKKLQKAAGIRVAETESYFSHTRPTYGTPFQRIRVFSVDCLGLTILVKVSFSA